MHPNGFENAHLFTEREKQYDKHLFYASKTLLKINTRHRNAPWKNETDDSVK